jgi:hypothetical protein
MTRGAETRGWTSVVGGLFVISNRPERCRPVAHHVISLRRKIVLSLQEAPPSVLLKCTSSAEARAADQSRSLPRLQRVQLHALRVAWRPGCDSTA